MNDLVHRKRCCFVIGVVLVVIFQLGRDAIEPLLEHGFGSSVECWERTNDTSFALRNDEIRVGNDEKGRANDRNRQVVFEN